MLSQVFERFIEKAPVAVMVRGVLERVLNPDALDGLYERVAVKQYTRELLFSNVVELMNLVVCRIHPSIHTAYQDHKEEIETSIASVYNKLNGIDTETSRALVKDTAAQLGESVHGLEGARTPWLAGYRVKVLEGNCIEATHHRIEPLRGIGAGALPGKSLVIYEPHLEMATDVFPCEDGHAQERSLLGAVLPTLEPRDILIMDRNFCVRAFLHGILRPSRPTLSAATTRDCPAKRMVKSVLSGVARPERSMNSGSGSAIVTGIRVASAASASF